MRLVISLYVLAIVAGFVATIAVSAAKCDARWDGVRASEWGLFSGCRVLSDGKFVPENRIWYERNN
jgi:hypothetical protein